jgi:hypothetical protein
MQKQDYEYFLQNTDQFYKQYGHKYLAIKDQGIFGVYSTFNETLENTLKTESLGSFLVQECLENREQAVRHFQSNILPVPVEA